MRLTSAQVLTRIFTVSTEIGWEEGDTFTICGIYGGSFLDDVGVGLKIFRTFSKWPPPPHPSQVINYQPPSTISRGNFSVNSKNILMILTSELSVFPRSHEKQ